MSQNPWWHPSDDDLGFGNIDWRYSKFPPALLDRLAAWQQEFGDNYRYGMRTRAV